MYRVLYIPTGSFFPLDFDDYIHACDWIRQSAFVYGRLTSIQLDMPMFQIIRFDENGTMLSALEIYTQIQ